MVKPNELYEKTKLPVDEKLIKELLNKYLNITLNIMNSPSIKVSQELYKSINIIESNSNNNFNKNDLDKLIKEINNDFVESGKPYNPSEHNGITNPLGLMPGWYLFQSWNLLGTEKINTEDINHRFYFAVNNNKVYDLANELYNRFKNANIPFYFKTEINSNIERTDNLVLYTSTNLLEQTLSILEQLEKDRSDLINGLNNPSILVGKLEGKIGYATEPHKSTTSYTDLVCETFVNCLTNYIQNYMQSNSNSKYKQEYNSIIQKYLNNGLTINDNVRTKVLTTILFKNEPLFVNDLLIQFKKELINKNIDVNNICFNKEIKQEIENKYGLNEQRIITLPNGKKMTIEEYLKINNVFYWIPPNAKVTLENGKEMTGKEFLLGVIQRIEKFNTFQELMIAYGVKIDRNSPQIENEINNDLNSGLIKK